MNSKQKETYEELIKLPNIYEATYPSYDDRVYLRVVGKKVAAQIKIHDSGHFSFVTRYGKRKSKYRYIKNVDAVLDKLYPETVVGLAFHLDKLYIK